MKSAKKITEAQLWQKIRDNARLNWYRLDNLNVHGLFDCLVITEHGIDMVELKAGSCFSDMELRPSQKKFALRLKGKTKNLYVVKYNYVIEEMEIIHYQESGTKKYTILKSTWPGLISALEYTILEKYKS